MPKSQINQVFLQKNEVSSDKPGLSGEKLGLSEKNLVYLIVVIFALFPIFSVHRNLTFHTGGLKCCCCHLILHRLKKLACTL